MERLYGWDFNEIPLDRLPKVLEALFDHLGLALYVQERGNGNNRFDFFDVREDRQRD